MEVKRSSPSKTRIFHFLPLFLAHLISRFNWLQRQKRICISFVISITACGTKWERQLHHEPPHQRYLELLLTFQALIQFHVVLLHTSFGFLSMDFVSVASGDSSSHRTIMIWEFIESNAPSYIAVLSVCLNSKVSMRLCVSACTFLYSASAISL